MSKGSARLGDITDGVCTAHNTPLKTKGKITGASGDTNINSKGAARLGDRVVADCGHISKIVSASGDTNINGQGAVRLGDRVSGGPYIATIISVSPDTHVNPAGNTLTLSPEHRAYLAEGVSTQVQNSEPLEYGDGGISNGDGEFLANNTSPANGVSGPQQTPANTSSFKRTSNPRLNFLPHTDPTLEPELENKLIELAKDWGQTLVITSAYRDPIYNENLKGSASTSLHMGRPIGSGKAMACDVVMSSYSLSDRIVFIEKAVLNGLRGIGIYNTFIHVDIGPKRCWGSNGSRRSMPSRCPWARPILQKYGYATGPN